jgi:CHAT domain-containing protein
VSFAGGETSSDEANKYFEDGRRLLAEFEGIDWFARWKERSAKRKLSSEEEKEFFQDWFRALPSLNAEHRMAAGIFYQKWGRVFLAAKQLGTAVDLLQQAFIYHASLPPYLESAFEQAKDLFFFAEASRQRGEHTLALQALRRAENLAASLRSPEIHWIYAGLARTYADLGDADKAMLFYEKGLAMLESIQHQQGNEEIKIGVLEGALYAYRGFINLLLNLYWKTSEERYLQQAFQVNERLRARVFLDMLAKSRATRLGGEVQWLAAEDEQIRRQVDRIHHQLRTFNKMDKAEETRLLDQLEALREKWRSLQRQAAQQSQRYQQIFFPRPVTVPEVQSALGADTALLEYSTAREGSTLWVITKDQFHAYTLPSEEGLPVLEAFLKTVREPLMGSNEVSQHVQLGQTMYRALLGPAEGQLRGKNHLVVVPDGPLYYLPFEALIIPERAGNETRYKGLAEVPYLVKQFGVSYVPSASILVTQRGKRNPIGKLWQLPLVAFGDPIYNEGVGAGRSDIETARLAHLVLRGGNLNRLEFSGEEVRRIAQIWDIPLNSEHINLGTRASVERLHELDLSRYRILHFATHGLLADEVGWATQPALVLSQSANSYGLLQFADILELKLNAELVVLSACNTSLGRLREAEGIVGLTRAFQYAGASAVVVSLWKVEDQSTSLLMEQFNLRLKKGESKAEALRRAKLEVLQSTIDLKALGMSQALASPFYWAPFILFGDWE